MSEAGREEGSLESRERGREGLDSWAEGEGFGSWPREEAERSGKGSERRATDLRSGFEGENPESKKTGINFGSGVGGIGLKGVKAPCLGVG